MYLSLGETHSTVIDVRATLINPSILRRITINVKLQNCFFDKDNNMMTKFSTVRNVQRESNINIAHVYIRLKIK